MDSLRKLMILFLMLNSFLSLQAGEECESLRQLDKEVKRYKLYVKKQEIEINRLQGNLQVASTVTDKYLSTKQLALAYSKFNSDSALVYFKKCQEMGLSHGYQEWYQEACIEEIRVCADRGDDLTATNMLTKLGTIDKISSSLKADYASASLLRFIKYQSAANKDSATLAEAGEIWGRLSPYLDMSEPASYLYYIYYVPDYDAKAVEQSIRKLLKPQTYDMKSAMGYLVLYNVLKKQGRQKEAFDALVRSAISDVRTANRSSSSLINILQLMTTYDCSDFDLADYVGLCEENVSNYKDVGRCIQLVQMQGKLEYLQGRKYQQNLRLAIVGGTILLFAVVLLAILLYSQKMRAKSKLHIYEKQTQQLKDLTSELKQSRELLLNVQDGMKSQHAKDRYSDAMLVKSVTLWVSIMKDNRSFKKEIANLLQTGMQRKARDLVNKMISVDQSFNQLFAWFDEIFLSLHPDFVERMNDVMRDECRFVLDEKNTLTPELRIFALISLGVTDTASVAEILHYSSQTVYNYKSKVAHGTQNVKFDMNKYVSEMYIL